MIAGKTIDITRPRAAALSDMVRGVRPDARAAVIGGSHLYGLTHATSDLDVWVFYQLPARAFLGLREPTLIHTESKDVEGMRVDLRIVDIKAVIQSFVEGTFYELEHIFSPHVLLGQEWLDGLRSVASTHATRRHYYGILRRTSTELRFVASDDRSRLRSYLHALRALLAGIHYLDTGELLSEIGALNKRHLKASYLDEALRVLRGEDPVATPWFEQLSADVDDMTTALEQTYRRSPLRDGTNLEADLDHFLRRMRLATSE